MVLVKVLEKTKAVVVVRLRGLQDKAGLLKNKSGKGL